jgi:LysM repeat protein
MILDSITEPGTEPAATDRASEVGFTRYRLRNQMERVLRMKTATSQQTPLANACQVSAVSRSKLKPFAALAAAAVVTLSIGLAMSFGAAAQETPSRTIATGSGIPLTADAPDRYTVKKGDTLWDIAKVFLRDPWYWPEIWYVNPQVKNPHLIYPGDTLALVSLNGKPQVSVAQRGPEGAAADAAAAATDTAAEGAGPTRSGNATRLSPQVRSEPITAAVTAVSYNSIAAFIGKPEFLSKTQVDSGPYIVGIRDRHLAGGTDHDIYASGLNSAETGMRYNIYHVDSPVRDPETNKVMGYRTLFVGTGTVTAPGKTAKLRIDTTRREALRGDKLYPEEISIPLDFIPHPVAENLRGSIMAVQGVYIAGKGNIVAINRGTKQGLEPGHVFAINQKGETVTDKFQHGDSGSYWSMGKKVKLPDERIGLVMIFKANEQMSYGLIMQATNTVRVGDIVVAP